MVNFNSYVKLPEGMFFWSFLMDTFLGVSVLVSPWHSLASSLVGTDKHVDPLVIEYQAKQKPKNMAGAGVWIDGTARNGLLKEFLHFIQN